MNQPLYTDDPLKGRKVLIGFLHAAQTGAVYLEKDVKEAVHRFRKYDGYAIQLDEFEKLKDQVSIIKINETDTGMVFVATIVDWTEKGEVIDEGHGKQWLLQKKFMHRLEQEIS